MHCLVTKSRVSQAFALAVVLFAPARARAGDTVVAAGQTLTLTADLVLSGSDTLEGDGTPSMPCTIAGNGHSITASGWSGSIKVTNCIFTGLGGGMTPAIDVSTMGTADVSIVGSEFDASGEVHLVLQDMSTATFNNNLLKDNGTAYIQDELVGSMYVPAFLAEGQSTAAKLFQGNRIYRDAAHFDGVDNWLIGGYGDQYSNIIIGHRGVIRVNGNHVKVVGNFINPQYQLTSPDVENITVGSQDNNPDLVVEHNVLNSGEWVLRECQGEVRYNLIADMNGHAWVKGPHDCNLHHNIFVNYTTPDPNREAGVDVVYYTPHLDIYNNTFDGGGMIANLGVPAIHAGKGRLIERVSSNAITYFVIPTMYASVSSTDDETQYDTCPPPGDARAHFADYNLFFNPDSPGVSDYTIQVEPDDVTPIPMGSDGFGKHDAHADPKYTGPLPTAFPFADADVEAGSVKVSDILKHYRDLYTPATGSPLIGTGDPTLSSNNNIGAIGQGPSKDPNDQFGTFMPGMGGGPPSLATSSSATSSSSTMSSASGAGAGGAGTGAGGAGTAGGGTGAGGSGKPSHGCSCSFEASPSASAALSAFALLCAVALRRRRLPRAHV
jgi:hypothetical protein